MAKSKHGEKSQAVRDYLTLNPNALASDVVAELKTKGISISKQLVSTIRSRMGVAPKKRGRKKAKGAGRKAGALVSLDALVKANKLIAEFGGIEKAKQALDALAQLK